MFLIMLIIVLSNAFHRLNQINHCTFWSFSSSWSLHSDIFHHLNHCTLFIILIISLYFLLFFIILIIYCLISSSSQSAYTLMPSPPWSLYIWCLSSSCHFIPPDIFHYFDHTTLGCLHSLMSFIISIILPSNVFFILIIILSVVFQHLDHCGPLMSFIISVIVLSDVFYHLFHCSICFSSSSSHSLMS